MYYAHTFTYNRIHAHKHALTYSYSKRAHSHIKQQDAHRSLVPRSTWRNDYRCMQVIIVTSCGSGARPHSHPTPHLINGTKEITLQKSIGNTEIRPQKSKSLEIWQISTNQAGARRSNQRRGGALGARAPPPIYKFITFRAAF